jgi:hypothetical protein
MLKEGLQIATDLCTSLPEQRGLKGAAASCAPQEQGVAIKSRRRRRRRSGSKSRKKIQGMLLPEGQEGESMGSWSQTAQVGGARAVAAR